MNARRCNICRCLVGLLCCFALSGPSVRGAVGNDPVGAFVQARRCLTQPPLSAPALPGAQQDPSAYLGQVFEVSATVGGLVSADGVRTALLSVGGVSLAARLPSSLSGAAWVGSGQTLRVLLRVEPDGNDVSLSNLRVLAAAPDAEVALWDSRQAAASSARPSYPSRSLAYARPAAPEAAPAVPTDGDLVSRIPALYWPYRNAIQGLNRRLSPADADKITRSILYFSARNRIDPRLVVAMVIAESSFDVYSTSRTGAQGLGQLMPGTARGLGVTDAYDPIQNIAASVHILRGNLDKYGGAPADAGVIPFNQIALTMAAYNAGSGAVRKYHGVPPYRETRRYVAKVTALYKKMCGLG